MIAWDVLTANSSLADGSAWDHLNAQEGGGEIVINVANGIITELSKVAALVELKTIASSVAISVISTRVAIDDV